MTEFENPFDFEKHVLALLKNEGWEGVIARPKTKGYDIKLWKGNETVAVQVKNTKAKAPIPWIDKFLNFLDLPEAFEFNYGMFITANGFAKTVPTYLRTEGIDNLWIASCSEGKIEWLFPPQFTETAPILSPPEERKIFGVFTCKGGVGKTTVAAHLAGAFSLCGYNSILIDMDPQHNLRKLLGDGVYLPGPKGQLGATVTVLNHEEWIPNEYPDVKIVVCEGGAHGRSGIPTQHDGCPNICRGSRRSR